MVSVYTAVVVDVWCQCRLQWWLVCGVNVDCSGCWRLAVGGWRLAVGGWRLAVGGWRLAVGGWRLAVGGWFF